MILDVPYYSQKEEEVVNKYGHDACGLTAIRMVLDFYGADSDFSRLAQIATKTEAYNSDQGGWFHAGLLRIARELGLMGYRINYQMLDDSDLEKAREVFEREGGSEEEFNNFTKSFKFAQTSNGISDIKRLIEEGIPVIVSLNQAYTGSDSDDSHLVVVIGTEGENLIINDPWDNGPKHVISEEKFLNYWTKRAVVILPPSKSE